MGRVLRRPLAREDILGVWDYIAEISGIEAADHWIEQLDVRLNLLATQPLMGGFATSWLPACAASHQDVMSCSICRCTTVSRWCACCTAHATSTPYLAISDPQAR